jgi:hypothetical protein
MAMLDATDACAEARDQIRRLAACVGEWAGMPLPLDGEDLVIEPSYPFAGVLGPKPEARDQAPDGRGVRNIFYSSRRRCRVVVWEGPDGRAKCGVVPAMHSVGKQIRTLGCSAAWGIEQESAAVQTLAGLLRQSQAKQYILTGTFLESSARSGVTYFFRRLRPTVALSTATGDVRILCALCMHPIAYYADSWAGAMCPTDDVIAHLMLMRGDEAMFWRRCNQHAAHLPEAGL